MSEISPSTSVHLADLFRLHKGRRLASSSKTTRDISPVARLVHSNEGPGASAGPLAFFGHLRKLKIVRVDVFTIFPDLINGYASESILGRATTAGLLDVRAIDIREAATDTHRTVDDAPFGGGAGMVMKPEPIFDAVEAADAPRPLFYLSPTGRRFDQALAAELSTLDGFSLLCGRYEGVDERVREHLVDGEISVGDFVLAGGELGAMVVIEAAARLIPGVLGNQESPADESFADGLLEYPHYTRPAEFRDWSVPDVLRSGDHAKVERWRRAQALQRTRLHRPDLIADRGGLSADDRKLLAEFDLPDSPA